MQTDWPAEHGEALRHYLAGGMSFARAADAINARFQTCYSRSATIGRAKRMGLAGPVRRLDRPEPRPEPPPQASLPRPQISYERGAAEWIRRVPVFEAEAPVELRRAAIDPRHLSLLDLKPGDCRYPYGGDAEGEAITFCGHPRRRGSSYCAAHCDLTRGSVARSEPGAGVVDDTDAPVAIMAVRMKRLPPRHRIAHLRALIRRQPVGSRRRRKLFLMLRDELAGCDRTTNERHDRPSQFFTF